MSVLVLVVLHVTSAAQPARGPLFPPFPLPAVSHGSFAFGDVDSDGDLDLAVSGRTDTQPVLYVFHLVDSLWTPPGGNFTYRIKVYRPSVMQSRGVEMGSLDWGDFDADGDQDLLVAGFAEYLDRGLLVERPILEIYRNTPQPPVLGPIRSPLSRVIELPGLYRASAEWGDYDGDGRLDFIVSGLPADEEARPQLRLYRNVGGSFQLVVTDLPGIVSGDLGWSDYDGDGDLDLALTGDPGNGVFITRLYRNDGGVFVDSGTPLPDLAYGTLDWGDYDDDGDEDLLLAGGQIDPSLMRGLVRVFRNDGGTLVDSGVEIEEGVLSEAAWGDADRDGDLDIFLLGSRSALDPSFMRLFAFDGTGFVPSWTLPGMRFSAMAVADYNSDGDADIVMSGLVGNLRQVRFILNWDYQECVLPAWVAPGSSTGNC